MHCVITVAVAAESLLLYGKTVEIRYQSIEDSRSDALKYAFIASPCPNYSCGIVWGGKGIYEVFLVPYGVTSSSPPSFLSRRWLHIRWPDLGPGAQLDQTHITAPINVELPEQAHGAMVLSGTAFQHRVWRALLDIPVGETKTYADIAHAVGRPRAWRAVANAVAANPLLCLVPCHRVVPRRGGVGKYRCGTGLKQLLLAQEGINFTE